MYARISISTLLLTCTLSGAFAHDDTAHGEDGHAHHTNLEIASDVAPRVALLAVEPDPVGGFNLFITTENFEFAPELVNQEHVQGKGHAHVYVDGTKIARIYAPAYHLESLDAGERHIEVTLNANDHREYSTDGARISGKATVVVP